MQKIKLIVKVIIIILIICGIIIFMWLKSLFGPYSSQQKIEKEFYKNYSVISELTSYMEKTGFENIDIQGNDYIYDDGNFGTWYVCDDEIGTEGIEKIPDVKLVGMLNEVFTKRKYQVVNKNGSTISFQLWSNLDASEGVAYVNGGDIPSIPFLTKYKKLDKENWFYYEADFNEWKSKNE